MKLSADYHTHSKHSRFWHGKSSIIEMSYRANELGLKELAITDHAYKHLFRTNKEKLYDARLTIDDLNKWSKTKILLGIEADILDENGTLDIDVETLALIDVLIAGYHKMIKTDFASFFGKQENTPEAKQKATNAFLNAIDKYPISIIAHLDSILQTDLYQIGKACAEKGVFVEINNRHTNWTQEQMDELLASGCSFVLSSDAHCADDIGNVNNAFDIMLKYNIPSERIVNVDFDFGEMSEEHKELNRLYDSYLRQKNKIEIKEKEIQEQKDFSTIKLSKEMEDALAQIEREQRGDYSSSETKEETQEPETDETTVAERNEQNIHNFLNEINSIAGARPQNEIKVNADGGSAENAEETSGESAETEEETKTSLETDQAQTEESESEENAAEAKQNSAETEENKPILENVEVAKKDEIPNAEMKPKSELKRGKAEINLNTKKPEPKEERKSEPEEVKNLFSVNVATGTNAKQDTSAKKTSQNKSNSSSRRGNPGAFVNISSLTGEDDGEN